MAPKKSMLAKAAPAAKPYRRRVPIKIVESNAAAASSAPAAPAQSNIAAKSPDALLNPVSSRTLSSAPSSSKTPAPPTPQKPLAEASVPTSGVGKNNFTVTPRDPWEVREVNGHRIGGGIIRRAAVSSNPMGETNPGNIKNERSSGSASPSSKPATPSGPDNSASASTFDVERMAATAPTPTLFDFTRSWNNSKDLEGKWKTLQVSSNSYFWKIGFLAHISVPDYSSVSSPNPLPHIPGTAAAGLYHEGFLVDPFALLAGRAKPYSGLPAYVSEGPSVQHRAHVPEQRRAAVGERCLGVTW